MFDSLSTDKRHQVATIFKIINITTFAICSLIWKLKLPHLPSEQQYFLQTVAATLLLLVIMIVFPGNNNSQNFLDSFRVHSFKSYFYRAAINFVGVLAWTKALKLIGMNEAMIVTYLTPVITAFIAVLFFKEKVHMSWVIALVLGIVGMLVILLNNDSSSTSTQDNFDHIIGIGLAVFTAIAFSVYNIICKQQGNHNDGHFAQAFYCFFLGTIFSLPLVYFMWQPIAMYDVIWSAIVGAIGVLSVVTLFLAYKLSSVTKIAPHSYLRIIITAITMYFVKDEIPSKPLMIAIGFILLGNFCVVFESKFYKIVSKFYNQKNSIQV